MSLGSDLFPQLQELEECGLKSRVGADWTWVHKMWA